jgi:hypothetical protein
MTWELELIKTENDTLRTTGDVNGIVAKYNGPSGTLNWLDVSLIDLKQICFRSMENWSAADWTVFENDHLGTDRTIQTSILEKRAFIETRVTVDEWNDLKNLIQKDISFAQSLNLNVNTKEIISVLCKLDGSPQKEYYDKHEKIKNIKTKINDGALNHTSLSNLTTINDLIGS